MTTATRAPRRPARAEIVGSLLRPPALRDAIDRSYAPGHRAVLAEERARDRTELHRVEDEAIDEAVRRQIDVGLDVVSDGEFRRYMFLNSFWDAVEGFSTDRNPVEFRGADGSTVTWQVQRIEERLRPVGVPSDSPAAREAAHLAGVTNGHPFKVTFPAASLFAHPFTFRPPEAYVDLDELVAHCIEIERSLIAGRGNYRSRWLCEGSLAPVAERMFAELERYDAFLVEWDDVGRDGGYEPIRHVTAGTTMVMGVVSTKTQRVEPEHEILRRIEEASRYLPADQLAVSPQCGFASVMEGNEIDEDVQWRKLDLVARVADRLWGRT